LPAVRHVLAVSLFAVVATVLTGSVLGDPTRDALGHPDNDVWNHVWGYWWVWDCLTSGRLPLRTELLNWPLGGTLWYIDIFGVLLTLPVQGLAGPVAAYNAACWGNLVLCGVGAYLLALSVSGSWPGAVLAGVCYLSSPHFVAQAYNGISETLAGGWLPLSLLAFRRALAAPTLRSGALGGAAWGVATLANWYYGLFSGLILAIWLARPAWEALGRRRVPNIGPLACGALAALAIIAGPFSLFLASMSAADAVVTRDPAFNWTTLILHNMTDAEALVHPGKFYSPDLKVTFDEGLIVVVYLGHALLWPALAALAGGWRRLARPWGVLFVLFTLFTLGPFLYAHGDYLQVFGGWIPMPFLLFFKLFPMFSRISHAYRFIVGGSLCLSVLVAITVRSVGSRGAWVAAVIGGARLAETMWLSPAVWPIPTSRLDVPAVYASLSGGAVLEMPVGIPTLARARYVAHQVVHRQPVPYGLNDPTPKFLYWNRYGHYLLELERSTVALLPVDMPWVDIALGRRELLDAGLRWIVLHRDPYPAPQYAKIAHFLDITATPVFADGALRVYRLDP
jgi:hypothetical protein